MRQQNRRERYLKQTWIRSSKKYRIKHLHFAHFNSFKGIQNGNVILAYIRANTE